MAKKNKLFIHAKEKKLSIEADLGMTHAHQLMRNVKGEKWIPKKANSN